MCSGLCVARMKEKQQGTDLGRRVQAEARGVHQQNKYVWKYHNETQYFVCFKNKNKKIKVTVLFCSQIYEDVASIGHNMGLGWGGYFIGVKIGLIFFSGSQFEFGSIFENFKNVHFFLPISS